MAPRPGTTRAAGYSARMPTGYRKLPVGVPVLRRRATWAARHTHADRGARRRGRGVRPVHRSRRPAAALVEGGRQRGGRHAVRREQWLRAPAVPGRPAGPAQPSGARSTRMTRAGHSRTAGTRRPREPEPRLRQHGRAATMAEHENCLAMPQSRRSTATALPMMFALSPGIGS
jgi:hypothetical protein